MKNTHTIVIIIQSDNIINKMYVNYRTNILYQTIKRNYSHITNILLIIK